MPEATRPGLHRLDGRARVAGHFDFRYHLDVQRRGVTQDRLEVLAREVATAVRIIGIRAGAVRRRQEPQVVAGVASPCADGRQLRQARDL